MNGKETALAIFSSLGGITGIVILTLNIVKKRIEKAVDEKISLKYNKELEKYKNELSKQFYEFKVRNEEKIAEIQAGHDKELEMIRASLETQNYVSKVRFDKEFEIYQKLCKALFDIYDSFAPLLPWYGFIGIDIGNVDYKGNAENNNDDIVKRKVILKLKVARNIIVGESPFIQQKIFDNYNKIINCHLEYINEHNISFQHEDGIPKALKDDEKDAFYAKYENFPQEMLEKRNVLLEDIRKYLKSLQVYQ